MLMVQGSELNSRLGAFKIKIGSDVMHYVVLKTFNEDKLRMEKDFNEHIFNITENENNETANKLIIFRIIT